VADKNMRFALEGLLGRHESLGIRPIVTQILVHPRRDSGTLRECHVFLRPWLREAACALVMLDREGCGSNGARNELEAEVRERLAKNGWPDRSAAVVIDPELDVWVWNDSPHLA